MAISYRFAAFLSYSSKDSAFAKRLHAALESYAVPEQLGHFQLSDAGKKNRIFPIFRDREELASGDLRRGINDALEASNALIIVCSPNAAASVEVNREVEAFLALGRRPRIFTIIADTVANPDNSGKTLAEACFPPALLQSPEGDSYMPIAADARSSKDGFRDAWLKLVAGIIGVNAGALQNRDRARRLRRGLAVALAGATVMSAVVSGFAIVQSHQTSRLLNNEADRLLAQGRYMEAFPVSIAAGAPKASLFGSLLGKRAPAKEFAAPILLDLGYLGEKDVAFTPDGRGIIEYSQSASTTGAALPQEDSVRMSLQPPFSRLPRPDLPPGIEVIQLQDENTFVTLSRDGTAAIATRRPSGQGFTTTTLGNLGTYGQIYASRRGDVIMTTSESQRATLRNAYMYFADVKQIENLGPIDGTSGFQFSPTGKYMALTKYGQETYLFSMTRDASNTRSEIEPIPLGETRVGDTIQNFLHWGGRLQFSNDDTVVIASDAEGHLGRAALDGSDNHQLVGQISPLGRWRLSPDGRWIAAWTQPDEKSTTGHLVLFSTNPGITPRVINTEAGQYDMPQFTQDSKHLIYESLTDAWSLQLDGNHKPERIQTVRTGNFDFTPKVDLVSDEPSILTLSEDGILRLHTDMGGAFETTPMARLGSDSFLNVAPGGHYLMVEGVTSDVWFYDLDVVKATTHGQSQGATCDNSLAAIRPLSERLRDMDQVPDARRPLQRLLRGRPWNPCDWRGLGDFEGWNQMFRSLAITYLGAADYRCEERNAAGQIDEASKGRCLRMRSLRTGWREHGFE